MSIYCQNSVREADYSLYILHFFAPRRYRNGILALFALHVEMQTIPQKTNDPTLITIRQKWWQDEIKKIYNSKPYANSPILDALSPVIQTYLKNDKNLFDHYCKQPNEAHLFDVCNRVMGNTKAWQKFEKAISIQKTLPPDTMFYPFKLWKRWRFE